MPSLDILDFRGGLDRRKSQATLEPGALWRADNVVLTRGNEIQKRRAFSTYADLPAGTVGMATTADTVVVFGSGANPGVPAGVVYQQLQGAAGGEVQEVLDTELFEGKLYVTTLGKDGQVYHYFDGARITGIPPYPVAAAQMLLGGTPRLASRGTFCPALTLGGRVYTAKGRTLLFSALGDPTVFDATSTTKPGAGFIEMSTNWGSAEAIVGLATYQSNLAVFMRDTIQLWRVDADPKAHQLLQVLPNIGALAGRSIQSFSDADTFFLSDAGVRSLQARSLSDTATTTDIGTPIDEMIFALLATRPADAAAARSVVEPVNGRYWLAVGDEIYVFSYFPSAKVSAWTRLLPGARVDEMDYLGNSVVARMGDRISFYNSIAEEYGDDYDCVIETPMLSAKQPTRFKNLMGMDAALSGTWSFRLGTDPANPAARELVATTDRVTYGMERLAVTGYGTHFGLDIRHRGPGPATLASLSLHFERGEDD